MFPIPKRLTLKSDSHNYVSGIIESVHEGRDESKEMQCLVESFLEKRDKLKIVDKDVTSLWCG